MNYTKQFKKYFRIKAITPLVLAGLIGSIITILFFPLQKEIEHYYWNKQNKQIVNQRKIERRLELLDELVVQFTRYNWCSIRAGVIEKTQVIEEDPLVCYQDSSTRLLGLSFQIKYYYDEEIVSKFDQIAIAIQDYEKDVNAGKPDAESGRKLRDLFTETVVLMQDRMLLGLN